VPLQQLEHDREATLSALARAYAVGALSTATLELRVEAALVARDRPALDACIWDLAHTVARWWQRRPARRAPPRALIVHDGDARGRVELPARPASLVIGRDGSCAIRVANTSVSRRHAVVSRRGELCRIRDLGSSNGTTVNGRDVDVADLARHDVLILGEVVIRVV
jgi:hypothetical protein